MRIAEVDSASVGLPQREQTHTSLRRSSEKVWRWRVVGLGSKGSSSSLPKRCAAEAASKLYEDPTNSRPSGAGEKRSSGAAEEGPTSASAEEGPTRSRSSGAAEEWPPSGAAEEGKRASGAVDDEFASSRFTSAVEEALLRSGAEEFAISRESRRRDLAGDWRGAG